ncbi:MAG TPA: hypothetical protein VFZ97_04220 [Acidimicrobiales bacterium]
MDAALLAWAAAIAGGAAGASMIAITIVNAMAATRQRRLREAERFGITQSPIAQKRGGLVAEVPFVAVFVRGDDVFAARMASFSRWERGDQGPAALVPHRRGPQRWWLVRP